MQSRIPNVRETRLKRPFPQEEHEHMLKDVTNTSYQRNSKKLTFGDETSIELVKTRQRKILGDINLLNQAIYEINKSISVLKDDEMITLRQDTQYLNNEILSMNMELEETDTEIQRMENDILLLQQQEKMWIENATLRYKIECQDKFNQLDMKFNDERSQLETQMNEFVDKFTPPTNVTDSILEYSQKLERYKKEWLLLKSNNDDQLSKIEIETLKPDLKQFQETKSNKLTQLKQSNNTLHDQLIKVKDIQTRYHDDLDILTVGIEECQVKIGSLETEINELTLNVIPPLQIASTTIDSTLTASTTSLEQLQWQYNKIKDEWHLQSNKLNTEKTTNQALAKALAKP